MTKLLKVHAAMLCLLLSGTVMAQAVPRYTEMAKGLSPGKAYLLGRNEYVNRLLNYSNDDACLYFVDIMTESNRKIFADLILQKDNRKMMGLKESATIHDIAYQACIKTGMLNSKRESLRNRSYLILTEDRILDERIDGDIAFVTVRFVANKIKRAVMVKEQGVWHFAGHQRAD